MLTLEEISDRLEIQALMTAYAHAIDQRDFNRLDAIFTADAYIDYRAMGGIAGSYPEVKRWLDPALAPFPNYQHLVASTDLELAGDTASARTACFNPMEVVLPEGRTQVMLLGLWYVDKLVRTAGGWRISERVQQSCYRHNVPEQMQGATGPAARATS
jgi:hypothetical protein